MPRLVDKKTGEEILVGQRITTVRGEVGLLKAVDYRNSRVIVRLENDFTIRDFHPHVIGSKIVAS